jgi:hypothetical protein
LPFAMRPGWLPGAKESKRSWRPAPE